MERQQQTVTIYLIFKFLAEALARERRRFIFALNVNFSAYCTRHYFRLDFFFFFLVTIVKISFQKTKASRTSPCLADTILKNFRILHVEAYFLLVVFIHSLRNSGELRYFWQLWTNIRGKSTRYFVSISLARNKNALCIKRRAFTIQRDVVQRIPELEKSETMHVSVSLVYWSEWNVY